MSRTGLLILTLACVPLLAVSAPLEEQVNKTPSSPNGFQATAAPVVNKTGGIISKLTCEICEGIATVAQKMFNDGTEWDLIAELAGELCYKANIQDEKVCKSICFEFKVLLKLLVNCSL